MYEKGNATRELEQLKTEKDKPKIINFQSLATIRSIHRSQLHLINAHCHTGGVTFPN